MFNKNQPNEPHITQGIITLKVKENKSNFYVHRTSGIGLSCFILLKGKYERERERGPH